MDAYGAATAAAQLDELLTQWRDLEHAVQTQLRITARSQTTPLRLTFAWRESYD
jgi:hypothetical protein